LKRTVLIFCAIFGGALVLTACGGGDAPPATTAPATLPAATDSPAASASPAVDTNPAPAGESALPLDDSGQPLVARVNGQPITATAFERALARGVLSSTVADPDALADSVLDILIEQAIIEQSAAELGVSVSEAEIDADIAEMVSLAGSPDAWASWKTDNLYTDAEYREAARAQLLTLKVRDAVVAAGGQPDAATTTLVRQARARHILVSTEAEAQNVLRRLNAGESFDALAAELSKDVTTKDRGGDLGFFIRENLTTPELADAAFALQPGQLAPDPVQTMLGYHVVQTMEFSEAAASPADAALQEEARFSTWLQARRAAASIERFLN
jgi:parvulin-like peptidyl-prolyl isomerase